MLLELLANDVGPPRAQRFENRLGDSARVLLAELRRGQLGAELRAEFRRHRFQNAVDSDRIEQRSQLTRAAAPVLDQGLGFGFVWPAIGLRAVRSAGRGLRRRRVDLSAGIGTTITIMAISVSAPSSISLGASVTVTDSAALLARWRATRSRVLALISLTDFLPVPIANSS